jgi:hypothetical protein
VNLTPGKLTRVYINKLSFTRLRGSPEWSHEAIEERLLVNFYDLVCEILALGSIDEVKEEIADRSFAIVMETLWALRQKESQGHEEKTLSIEDVLALEIFNGPWIKEYDIEAVASDFSKLFNVNL